MNTLANPVCLFHFTNREIRILNYSRLECSKGSTGAGLFQCSIMFHTPFWKIENECPVFHFWDRCFSIPYELRSIPGRVDCLALCSRFDSLVMFNSDPGCNICPLIFFGLCFRFHLIPRSGERKSLRRCDTFEILSF